MTAQEKAKELYSKFYPYVDDYILPEAAAKELCIIAIEEMIRIAPWGGDNDVQTEDGSKEFYTNVKTEIEKL